MNGKKIETFMRLAGQVVEENLTIATPEARKLGAQLLLSEVLEYVIHGLGVVPVVNGVKITEPDSLHYEQGPDAPDTEEMLDGLADVAYTMYWNAVRFGLPLEDAFDLVCDNNLTKFVNCTGWKQEEGELEHAEWNCGNGVSWPEEVSRVELIQIDSEYYAVGTDSRGKVRKPSTYQSVDLKPLLG